MAKTFISSIQNAIKMWFIPVIVGAIFIAVGIYSFTIPETAYEVLSIVFSISFIVAGIAEIVFSISNRKSLSNWGWILTLGIATLIVGILLIQNQGVALSILPYYFGFLLMFRSIAGITISLDMRDYGILDWGVLFALSILGLLFSFVLLWNPLFAGMTLVIWTGLAMIAVGAFSIYFGFKVRQFKNYPKKLSKELKDRYNSIVSEIQSKINEINSSEADTSSNTES